ncbi:MAG TPA: hypothetical protein VGH24_13310 [Solirubrobacteraceae bacterium]
MSLVVLAAVATAAGVTSIGVASGTVAGKPATIVVDGRGVTVYELGGESLVHLQCVTRACFNVWQPLKVPSAASRPGKAARVPGKLSVMRRVLAGFYQLMLNRHPLYYFSGDRGRKGSTKGQGIKSYGGTWHVVRVG